MTSRTIRSFLFAVSAASVFALQAGQVLASESATKPKICVVQPKAQLGQGDSGVDVSDPVHATLIAYLSGPAAEVTPLTALIPGLLLMCRRRAGPPWAIGRGE